MTVEERVCERERVIERVKKGQGERGKSERTIQFAFAAVAKHASIDTRYLESPSKLELESGFSCRLSCVAHPVFLVALLLRVLLRILRVLLRYRRRRRRRRCAYLFMLRKVNN